MDMGYSQQRHNPTRTISYPPIRTTISPTAAAAATTTLTASAAAATVKQQQPIAGSWSLVTTRKRSVKNCYSIMAWSNMAMPRRVESGKCDCVAPMPWHCGTNHRGKSSRHCVERPSRCGMARCVPYRPCRTAIHASCSRKLQWIVHWFQ